MCVSVYVCASVTCVMSVCGCACVFAYVCVRECAAVVNIWEFVLSYRSVPHFFSFFAGYLCATLSGLARTVKQFVCLGFAVKCIIDI